MDFVSPDFQYCDQMDELFHFSSIPYPQPRIQEDSILVTSSSCKADVTRNPDCFARRKSSVAGLDDDNHSDYKRKKIIHRDVERQRRQQMATLYRSLRSLLPVEYVKGKRSMSDHMLEAVSYIRQLQKRVEEKRQKREELKRSFDPSTDHIGVDKSQCFPSCVKDSVTVEASKAGIQIAMSTAMSGGIFVSRVLEVLLREGLNVVSCISTNIEDRLHHVIDSEVSGGTSINPSELRKKLTDLMV